MPLELATPNPAYATIKKLLSPAVDVLLRPKGGWKRPDDLLGALAEKIATNQGERNAWDQPGFPRIADPEKAEVIGTLNAALKSAYARAYSPSSFASFAAARRRSGTVRGACLDGDAGIAPPKKVDRRCEHFCVECD